MVIQSFASQLSSVHEGGVVTWQESDKSATKGPRPHLLLVTRFEAPKGRGICKYIDNFNNINYNLKCHY